MTKSWATPLLFRSCTVVVGLSAMAVTARAEASTLPALECQCANLAFLDVSASWGGAASVLSDGAVQEALAATVSETGEQRRIIDEQRQLIDRQSAMIAEQRDQIEKMQQHLAQQQIQVDRLSLLALADRPLDSMRGAGLAQGIDPALPGPGSSMVSLPDSPVGEAPPPEPRTEERVAAVPEGQGVLTPAGKLVFEPSFEYTRSSTNRLVFRGLELIPGIQIG